jgi:transposase
LEQQLYNLGMKAAAPISCPECQRLQAQLKAQRAQLESLQATVDRLEQRLASAHKDSSTSSKPPSSDIVKPPKPASTASETPRSIGGQPGHPKHERAPFRLDQVTSPVVHALDHCPCCGGQLRLNGGFARVVQQIDILQPPWTIEQHTCPEYWCIHCEKAYKAPMPEHIEKGGLVGPRLTALIAYLKGVCHASYSTVRKYLRDIFGLTISRSQLANVIAKVSEAMEQAYQQLLHDLPGQTVLNVDETSHNDKGDRMWIWCFRADLYSLFKIDPTRSGNVLIKVLGEEFDGVLGCDCYSAYRRYMREFDVRLQFCLAHLIREVKYLTTLPDKATRSYGERFREALRRLFQVIHKRDEMPQAVFRSQLEAARADVMRQATQDVPASKGAKNLALRMQKYGDSYFRFITTADVQPTNNVAEQAIRFVVIDRHITQGTRGEKGQRWSERIWTVMATCSQQGRSVWDYLQATVQAYFTGGEAPTLLPAQV